MFETQPCVAETLSGKQLNLDNPNADDIDLLDVASGLAQICRYSGQVWPFYSVAEHAFHCYQLCLADIRRTVRQHECRLDWLIAALQFAFSVLNHDDAEAFVGDMRHDIKRRRGMAGYRLLEDRVQDACCRRFDVANFASVRRAVKRYDRQVAKAEANVMFHSRGQDWDDFADVPLVHVDFFRWQPEFARREFLRAFFECKASINEGLTLLGQGSNPIVTDSAGVLVGGPAGPPSARRQCLAQHFAQHAIAHNAALTL